MQNSLDFLSFPIEVSELDPVSYQYFNNLLNHRTIVWNCEIDDSFIEKVYLPLRNFEKDNSDKPVTLIINSIGGEVANGLFFANYLTTYSKPLRIIVCGYAASMAAIVLAAGGKNDKITRWCYPSSYAMIHDGQVEIPLMEAKSVSDILAFQDVVNEEIRQFIIDNTNITAELYDAHARKQWFITSKEMKDLNLVDKIFGQDDESL